MIAKLNGVFPVVETTGYIGKTYTKKIHNNNNTTDDFNH